MTTYVVSLTSFVPGVRYDGKPWTKARIEQALAEIGPWTPVDTQELTPLDSNPEQPQARNFTTTKATIPAGYYRVTFLDAEGNEEPSGAVYSPARSQLSPGGNPSVLSARNAVRHQLRDGVPVGDTVPVPFNMVRLEPLNDQVGQEATPTLRTFQVRYDLVPTQQHMTVTACPATLVAFVDGSWTPTAPTQDVDQNGNFTLPVAPARELLVTYAWQYLSDGEVDNFVERARQWLREWKAVSEVPDGLSHALTQYAAALALRALQRSATLANSKAGDAGIDFGELAKTYQAEASSLEKRAEADREAYYSRGPEPLEPFVESEGLSIDPYEPLR